MSFENLIIFFLFLTPIQYTLCTKPKRIAEKLNLEENVGCCDKKAYLAELNYEILGVFVPQRSGGNVEKRPAIDVRLPSHVLWQ